MERVLRSSEREGIWKLFTTWESEEVLEKIVCSWKEGW